VEHAMARHGELLLNHLEGQMASEAKTKAAARRLKEDSSSGLL
jgi:hypothetical protein